MKIAIPLAEGKLAMHFGHCASFALIEVDEQTGKIIKKEEVAAPPHQPGLLPQWLAERGATIVIAGGMGQRARSFLPVVASRCWWEHRPKNRKKL